MYISLNLPGSRFTAKPVFYDDSTLDECGYIRWEISCKDVYDEWTSQGLKIPLFQESEEGIYEYVPRHHDSLSIDTRFVCEATILKYLGMKVLCFDGSVYGS